MQVSLNQLKKMVDFPYSPGQLAEKLTHLGLEVREIKTFGRLEKILVGKILKVKKHPNADRLKIVDVDIGKEKISLVCGAPNLKEGCVVPVALEGAELPGKVKVEKVRIRGITSPGMICSEKELGLGEDHSGVMILPCHLSPGNSLSQALELEDVILDLEITSNRGDCLSVLGVAREIAILTRGKVHLPSDKIREDQLIRENNLPRIKIDAPDLCPYYAARVIKDVQIGPSPLWLRQKILVSGANPINNVVDVTNYVMWEIGQPLHPFDLDTIRESTVLVRRAKKGESLFTLDDKCRSLNEEMLVIADSQNAIALAGIMGGKETQVLPSTRHILLEAAYFDPVCVGKTSRKIGLITEASSRFEKGVDPKMVKRALNRAALLIQEVAGGKIVDPLLETGKIPLKRKKVYFRPFKVNKVMGGRITSSTMEDILKSLGFQVKKSKKRWTVNIPDFRQDITREIDLVEEICRVYGYNRVKATLPSLGMQEEREDKEEKIKDILRALLKGCGFYEVVTNSLTSERLFQVIGVPREKLVYIRNPLSREQQVLRVHLFPQLLNIASFNYNQESKRLRIMEIGKVFDREGNKLREKSSLAALVVEDDFNFFSLKGIVEAIMEELGVEELEFTSFNLSYLCPGESALIKKGNQPVGYLGRLSPQIGEIMELPKRTYLFELDVNFIVSVSQKKRFYRPLPKFPSVKRDLSVVIKENVSAAEVKECVLSQGEWIEEVEFFDVYRDGSIPSGCKSIAFSLTFRHPSRTLTDEEVNTVQERIIRALKEKLGASLRSK